MLLGPSIDEAARIIAALSAGLIALFSWQLLRRNGLWVPLALAASGLIAVAPTLASISRMAWTEPPFTVVVLLMVLVLDTVRRRGTRIRGSEIAVLIVLTWLAVLLRVAGLGLIPGVAFVVLVVSLAVRPGLRAAALYTFGSLVIPLAWVARNLAVSGTYGGPQAEAIQSLMSNLYNVVRTIGQLMIPFSWVPSLVSALLGVALGFTLAIWVGMRFRQGIASPSGPAGLPLLLASVGVSFTVFVLLSARITHVSVNERMLSPVLPLLVILAALALQEFGRSRRWQQPGLTISALLVGGLALMGAYTTAQLTRSASIAGIGYNNADWRASPLVASTAELPGSANIYSNRSDAIWAVIRRPGLRNPPRARGIPDEIVREQLEEFVASACEETYLVWFDETREYLFAPEELRRYVRLELVHSPSDGDLYKVSRTVEQAGASNDAICP